MGFFRKLKETREQQKQHEAYVKQHDAYVKEGEKCEALGDLKGAVESYTKAIEMRIYKDKTDLMLHYKRACVYEKMKEMEKAADDFRVFLTAKDGELKVSAPEIFGEGFAAGWRSQEISNMRGTAKSCLAEQAFERVLSTYDFDIGYSDEKLYKWDGKFKEASKMLKENPQEAAYRMGVVRLLEGNQKDAIQRLDKAIEMNPEDARFYLFRGIAHALQSRKGGIFGPSRSAKELSKTKAMSDFEQAIALRKDDAVVEQAGKWKNSLAGE